MVQITSTLLDSWASYCVGRRDEYAIQHQDGRYLRAGSPLTFARNADHWNVCD